MANARGEGKFGCDLRTWGDMWDLSKVVAGKIRESSYRPDFIIGITRGGWIPAVNLSDLLGVRDLLSLKVEHWGITATADKRARLKFPLKVDLEGKKVLLVDDLTDTGESLKLSLRHVKTLNPREVRTATLIHKSMSRFTPDYYAEGVREWVWIIFPWNVTEDLCNLLGKVFGKGEEVTPRKAKKRLKTEFDLRIDDGTLRDVVAEYIRGIH